MTKVIIGLNSIEISGHSSDPVVCHGVSAISQMVANYVEKQEWGIVERNDGYLIIYDIPGRYYKNPLFRAMIEGLKDIEKEYPGAIEVKYKTIT